MYVSDPHTIFKSYSQKSCQFECILRLATDKAGCLPWDFPVPTTDEDVPPPDVCVGNYDADQLIAFRTAMFVTDVSTCDCLPDCERIAYEVHVDKIPLPNRKELCRDVVFVYRARN